MSEKYDGWVIREKDGAWWFGTYCKTKEETKAHLRDIGKLSEKDYGLKIVKVKLIEIE